MSSWHCNWTFPSGFQRDNREFIFLGGLFGPFLRRKNSRRVGLSIKSKKFHSFSIFALISSRSSPSAWNPTFHVMSDFIEPMLVHSASSLNYFQTFSTSTNQELNRSFLLQVAQDQANYFRPHIDEPTLPSETIDQGQELRLEINFKNRFQTPSFIIREALKELLQFDCPPNVQAEILNAVKNWTEHITDTRGASQPISHFPPLATLLAAPLRQQDLDETSSTPRTISCTAGNQTDNTCIEEEHQKQSKHNTNIRTRTSTECPLIQDYPTIAAPPSTTTTHPTSAHTIRLEALTPINHPVQLELLPPTSHTPIPDTFPHAPSTILHLAPVRATRFKFTTMQSLVALQLFSIYYKPDRPLTVTTSAAMTDSFFRDFLIFSNPIGSLSFNSLYEKIRCFEGLPRVRLAFVLRQFHRDLLTSSRGSSQLKVPYVPPEGQFRGKEKYFIKSIARFEGIPSAELTPLCKQR
jgi:hypothetical protein